jgi:hypothetical protein
VADEKAQMPVLTFPLPIFVGGGIASIGAKPARDPGKVDLIISAGPLFNGVVTMQAASAFEFVQHLSDVCIAAMPTRD